MPLAFRLVGTVFTMALLGCGSGQPPAQPPTKGPAAGPPGMGSGMPVAVITSRVARQSFVDRFTALGTARANEAIEVTARTTSVVTRINFREGQRARAGETLLQLENL